MWLTKKNILSGKWAGGRALPKADNNVFAGIFKVGGCISTGACRVYTHNARFEVCKLKVLTQRNMSIC